VRNSRRAILEPEQPEASSLARQAIHVADRVGIDAGCKRRPNSGGGEASAPSLFAWANRQNRPEGIPLSNCFEAFTKQAGVFRIRVRTKFDAANRTSSPIKSTTSPSPWTNSKLDFHTNILPEMPRVGLLAAMRELARRREMRVCTATPECVGDRFAGASTVNAKRSIDLSKMR